MTTHLLNLRPDGITPAEKQALTVASVVLPATAEAHITNATRADAHRLNIAAVVEEAYLHQIVEFMEELWHVRPDDSDDLYDRFAGALTEYYGKEWHLVRDSA